MALKALLRLVGEGQMRSGVGVMMPRGRLGSDERGGANGEVGRGELSFDVSVSCDVLLWTSGEVFGACSDNL